MSRLRGVGAAVGADTIVSQALNGNELGDRQLGSSDIYRRARTFSSGVSQAVVLGQSGRTIHAKQPTKDAPTPSVEDKLEDVRSKNWARLTDEEEPFPASESTCAVQVLDDDTSKEAGEGTLSIEVNKIKKSAKNNVTNRNGGRSVIDGVALSKFVALVPRRQIEGNTGGETSLDDSETETNAGKLLPAVASGKTGSDPTPHYTDRGQTNVGDENECRKMKR